MVQFYETLISLGICVVLPIVLVWIVLNYKITKDKGRKDIILAVLEKNGNVDVQELMRSMNRTGRLLKEKLLRKFQVGLVMSFVGLLLMAVAACMAVMHGGLEKAESTFLVMGGLFFVVGAATLISYRVGKQMLEQEMNAEAQDMQRA